MSALDVLSEQCERRGWRVGLTCTYPDGRQQAGAQVDALQVRDHDHGLLASVWVTHTTSELELEAAAAEVAHVLDAQGLIDQ